MDALDGNAIGGLLIDVFGTEMTAASSTCGTCGASRPVAELVVYRRAPGTVVRCRTCGSVLMVFVKAHGVTCTDLTGLASLSQAGPVLSGRRGPERTACQTSTHKGTRKRRACRTRSPCRWKRHTKNPCDVGRALHVNAGARPDVDADDPRDRTVCDKADWLRCSLRAAVDRLPSRRRRQTPAVRVSPPS
jgi:hypothetical protein